LKLINSLTKARQSYLEGTVYNSNANTRSFFLSSIATRISENRERRRQRRRVQKKNKLSNLPFSKIHLPFGPTSLYIIVGDQWMGKLTLGHGS
jgi:hypothetical protein